MPRLVVPIVSEPRAASSSASSSPMIGHYHLRAGAEPQVFHASPGRNHRVHLLDEGFRVHDATRPDDVRGIWVEDAAGDQVQRVLAIFVDHRVAGVVTALETDDHVRVLCKVVDNASFALISPLSSDDCSYGHDVLLVASDWKFLFRWKTGCAASLSANDTSRTPPTSRSLLQRDGRPD